MAKRGVDRGGFVLAAEVKERKEEARMAKFPASPVVPVIYHRCNMKSTYLLIESKQKKSVEGSKVHT